VAGTKTTWLLILPALLVAVGLCLTSAQGPYFLGRNFDPDYPYLLNGLSLAQAKPPVHIDHPGTTMQMLIAVGLRAVHAARRSSPAFEEDVLAHPEVYLRLINAVLILLAAAAMFIAGRMAAMAAGSLWAGLLVESSVFWFPSALLALGRVTPEPLLLCLSMVYVAIFMTPELQPRRAVAAGIVFALGTVAKVTFLPLAALAAVIPGWKNKSRFVCAAAVTGLVCLLPALPQWRRMLGWFLALLTHSGSYGAGPRGLPDWRTWFASVRELASSEPFFLVWMGLLLWAVPARAHGLRRLGWAALAGTLVQLIMVAKQPRPHYLLPAFALLALAAWVAVRETGVAKIAAVAVTLSLAWTGWTITKWESRTTAYREEVRRLDDAARALPGCLMVGYYRSSAPTFGLMFGDLYAGFAHASVLGKLHPKALLLALPEGQFRNWHNQVETETVRAEVARGGCILLEGTPIPDEQWNTSLGLRRVVVAAGEEETLYRLGPAGAP
jgi:hypothetical protein